MSKVGLFRDFSGSSGKAPVFSSGSINELNVHDGLLLGLDDSWGEVVEVNGNQNDVSVLADLDARRLLEVVLGKAEESAAEPGKSLLNSQLEQVKAVSLYLWDLRLHFLSEAVLQAMVFLGGELPTGTSYKGR